MSDLSTTNIKKIRCVDGHEHEIDARYFSGHEWNEILAFIESIGTPMRFMGLLGTGGTISELPAASSDNSGNVYKVITAGTYAGVACKIDDMVISNGTAWVLIPSGNEANGTVTNISTGVGLYGGPITDLGEIRANLLTETLSTESALQKTEGELCAVEADVNGKLAVRVSATDTKNTAGATNIETAGNSLYLIGASEQSANPQTYTSEYVYVNAGILNTNGLNVHSYNIIRYNEDPENPNNSSMNINGIGGCGEIYLRRVAGITSKVDYESANKYFATDGTIQEIKEPLTISFDDAMLGEDGPANASSFATVITDNESATTLAFAQVSESVGLDNYLENTAEFKARFGEDTTISEAILQIDSNTPTIETVTFNLAINGSVGAADASSFATAIKDNEYTTANVANAIKNSVGLTSSFGNTDEFVDKFGTSTISAALVDLAENQTLVSYTLTEAAGYLIGSITIDGTTTNIYGRANREVKVNGATKIGASTTTPLDLSAGSNITLTYTSDNKVQIDAEGCAGHVYNAALDSLAEGVLTLIGGNAYQLNNATGIRSHAQGINTTASGNGAFASGYADSNGDTTKIEAAGHGSVAVGYVSSTSGNSSIYASGDGAIAFGCTEIGGFSITASGKSAIAGGYLEYGSVCSLQNNSISYGDDIINNGDGGVAIGLGLTISTNDTLVYGKYNVDDPDMMFILANGDATGDEKNIFTVDRQGLVYATHFYETSDERLKDFLGNIDIDFNKLKSIPKKYFTWKADDSKERLIGTSAQELMKVYPEAVSYSATVDRYTVDYAKLSMVALAAVDKLHEENEDLKARVARLEEAIEKLMK